MSKLRLAAFAAIPVVATAAACIGVRAWLANAPIPASAPKVYEDALNLQVPLAPPVPPPFKAVDVMVEKGSSLSQLLKSFGMLKDERAALMDALRPYTDPARLAAGTPVKAVYAGPEDELPGRIELRDGPTHQLIALRHGKDDWAVSAREAQVEKRVAAFSGLVRSTLWSSATEAGMDPTLITRLTEVFACQFDFNRQVQEDDRWRLAVERLFVDGKPVGFGDVIAAEYASGSDVMTAVRYLGEGGRVLYFAPDGDSLQSLFLKSPLKYGHVTSGFAAKRFHPILKVNRPHLGVDYGAATGTPILAVGDGQVVFAGSRGPSGKMVEIKHNGTYRTMYKHMSAYAKGMTPGTRVLMGQVIGYVGATGLATGPHLHFEFHVGGKVVDPQGLKFPAADAVPAPARAAFQKAAALALTELPPWSHGVLSQAIRRSTAFAE